MWAPTPFIGFFSHHDGLMVTTVMQVRQALDEHHQWPFNQYGPSWALFFGTILSHVSASYLLVSMRLFVFAGYIVTAIFTFRTARLFGGLNFSLFSIILLTANQPFVFDLLPWPSAVVMPVVSIFAFLIVSTVDSEKFNLTDTNRKLFLSGTLVPLVIMSRIQVGFLLLAVGIYAVIAFQKRRQLVSFLSGFAISSAITTGFLAEKGWLIDAIRDQVIFGSSYLHSENNPFPKFTIASVLFILILIILARKSQIRHIGLRIPRQRLMIYSLLLLFICVFLVLFVHIEFMHLQTLITRKVWVSVPLACIAYLSLKAVSVERQNNTRMRIAFRDNRKTVLLLLSMASCSQIFPLFDQMHSWWAYTPSVILISLVLKELAENFEKSVVRKLQYSMVALVTILAAVNITVQFQNNFPLKATKQFSLTFTSQEQAAEMSKLQDFFSKSLPNGSRVLNLCENTDVFFNDQFTFTASRVFLYWPAMEKSEYLVEDIKKSRPDYVVVCRNLETTKMKFSQTGAPRVLRILNRKATQINFLEKNAGYEWVIYKYATSSR